MQSRLGFIRFILLHIPSSYAKIWGEIKFQLNENPQSESKSISVKKIEREREQEKERKKEGKSVLTMAR